MLRRFKKEVAMVTESFATQAPLLSYTPTDDMGLKRYVINRLEVLFGRQHLEAIYAQLHAEHPPLPQFFGRALSLGDVRVQLDGQQLAKIPRQGPVIFIANHPFGVVDGLIACDIAARTRDSFKVMLHSRLCKDDYLQPCFLPVSFDETKASVQLNVASKKTARRILEENGTIVIFPAGGVSTRRRLGFGKLADLPWSTFVAKLALQSNATIVPVYFHGENSRLFHFVSGFSQTLRYSLLLSEVSNKLGKTIQVSVRDPVTAADYASLTRKDLTSYLHQLTFQSGPEHLQQSRPAGVLNT